MAFPLQRCRPARRASRRAGKVAVVLVVAAGCAALSSGCKSSRWSGAAFAGNISPLLGGVRDATTQRGAAQVARGALQIDIGKEVAREFQTLGDQIGNLGTGDTAWMSDPVVSCVGWTVVLCSSVIISVATCMEEGDTPRSFLDKLEWESEKEEVAAPTPPLQGAMGAPVICLGDSITRGNLSADWVSTLREQLMGSQDGQPAAVLNAGVNMQCIENVKQRIEEVIACKPSHVTVLVGTNDLKAELSLIESLMYRVFGKLPEAPSLERYESSLREIREQLLGAGIRVALVSPPVLGEDLGCRANRRAAEFAATVRRVATEGQCAYLPLFEQTAAQLPKEGGKAYCGLNFFMWCCMLAFDIHVFRRDLSEVQRERKLGVTVDLVHLGPEAATDLAKMVEDFVRSPVPGDVNLALAQ